MNVQDTARDVGVSPEELLEILRDIDIAVEGIDAELSAEQISAVCDELGYGSIDAARADNAPQEPFKEVPEPATEGPVGVSAAADQSVAGSEKEEEPDANLIELKKPKIVVKEFAERMGMKPNVVIAELMRMNVFASINAEIDIKVAKEIGEKHGFTVRKEEKKKPVPQQSRTKAVRTRELEETEDAADALLN